MNELKVFSNEQFGNVRVVEINGEGWLVGRDVVEILSYKDNYTNVIKYHVDEDDYMFVDAKCNLNIDYKQLGQRGGYLVKEKGVYQLISATEVLTKKQKEDFINFLKDNGLLNHVSFYSRKEIEFINLLEKALEPFCIKGVRQYNVLSYKIDYYIPSLNIAIEYDEDNHKNYTYETHELRQELIEKELGCRFIRLTDYKDDAYNVGLAIKKIFNIGEVV